MIGRYRIEGIFAEGAQARLYSARDLVTNDESCVLKTGTFVKEEALLALELNHPFITKPYDLGTLPEVGNYAAYPKLREPSIREWRLKDSNGEDFRRVVLQIAEFLSFLHHRGWLYHDFKPEHFLVGDDSVKVLDLGLCSRIRESQISKTFSGTFPYISPERLSGRECDVRSDIFGLGMMLLHMFYPEEDWSKKPSVSVLQQLQQKIQDLPGYWKDILGQMTSLEPSQRPESVTEVWRKLLPESAKGTFLFYPIPATFSLDDEIFQKERIVIAKSPSQLNLKEIQNQALNRAWKSGITTLVFDFQHTKVEEWIKVITSIYCDAASIDFFSSVESLLQLVNRDEILIVLQSPEKLDPRQRGLLSFALSCLSRSTVFRVLITTAKAFSLLDESYKQIELPLLTKQDLQQLFNSILPSGGLSRQKIDRIRAKTFFTPEQVLMEFSKELPVEGYVTWPVVARETLKPPSIENLKKSEMRTLGCIALTGGSIPKKLFWKVIRLSEQQSKMLLDRLTAKGYLQSHDDKYFLNLPLDDVLSRLRKDRIREIAKALLAVWPVKEDVDTGYKLAFAAEDLRTAANLALRKSRSISSSGLKGEKFSWLNKAFICGAELPRSILLKTAMFNLRQGDLLKARRILNYVRKHFGLSYRLGDAFLDYDHRTNNFARAERLARQLSQIAKNRGHIRQYNYFLTKVAGFLILRQQFQAGEEQLKSAYDPSYKTKGLIHYFSGLSLMFRGNLSASIEEFNESRNYPHPLRVSSIMASGIAYARMGHFEMAEKCVRTALRKFYKSGDMDRLSRGYNNLGSLLMESGKTKVARQYFQRSAHLARSIRNQYVLVSALNNLAETYKVEARTDRVIRFHIKASRIANKCGLRAPAAMGLSNAGIQYAVQGKFRKAITCLRNALKIQKSIEFKMDLGFTYENLGLTYLYAKRYSKSIQNFNHAIQTFQETGSCLDRDRVLLYTSLVNILLGKLAEAKRTLDSGFGFKDETFELALHDYILVLHDLKCRDFNREICRERIYQAESIFRSIPNLFWLARLLLLKADYLNRTDHHERATMSLQSAYNIFSRLGARKELFELAKNTNSYAMPEDFLQRISEKLPYRILMMIKDVLAEANPDAMISKILSTSVEFTDMERAVLILSEDPPRIYKSTTLEESAIQEICEISKSATEEASEQAIPYIRLDASNDPHLRSKPSIIGNRIMSIVCLPLRAGEKIMGVLYLDSRERMEALATTETALLEIFASIIGLALNNTLILEKSLAENEDLRSSLGLTQFPEIIGTSEPMITVLKTVHQLLDTEIPILITGDTGTGKELIARVIHFCGTRKNGSFVAINCSALTKSLLESELFGHEKGSFTGAMNTKKGLFEQARHGTLFLDEIGEMPYSMQSKLLRVLQEGEFRRVGGNEELRTDARIVLATNRNLQELVKGNKFREDLYYRIKGVQIHLPSLKERAQDIPLLATHFLKGAITANKKKILGLTPEAFELLKNYDWPGNVRQLKNEIERVVALTKSEWILPGEFSSEIQEVAKTPVGKEGTLREKEKEIILERLHENKWNIFHTAKSLGLTRNGLYGKMKLHGIPRKLIQ